MNTPSRQLWQSAPDPSGLKSLRMTPVLVDLSEVTTTVHNVLDALFANAGFPVDCGAQSHHRGECQCQQPSAIRLLMLFLSHDSLLLDMGLPGSRTGRTKPTECSRPAGTRAAPQPEIAARRYCSVPAGHAERGQGGTSSRRHERPVAHDEVGGWHVEHRRARVGSAVLQLLIQRGRHPCSRSRTT